jgi:hypothetical protein
MSGHEVHAWYGMLAGNGSMVICALVCLARAPCLRDYRGVVNVETKTISYPTFGLTVLTVAASLYSAPEGMDGKMPFVFLAFMAVVLLLFVFRSREKAPCGRRLEFCVAPDFSHFTLLFSWLFLQNGRTAYLSARRTRVRQGVL